MKIPSIRVPKFIKSFKFIIAVIVVGGVAFFFYQRQRNGVVTVETYVVEREVVEKVVTASGKTSMSKGLAVRAPVAAKIDKLNFESGEEVAQGDVVLVLDQKSLNATMQTSWKGYLDAKADIDSLGQQIKSAETTVAEKKYTRDKFWREYMADNGPTNKENLKVANTAYEAAESALKVLTDQKGYLQQAQYSTYAAYDVAKQNLDVSEIGAPAAGLLALEDISDGSLLTQGQILFTITNRNQIQFTAEVDETDVQFIKLGQEGVVELDAYDDVEFEAETVRMDAKIITNDSGGDVVEVILDLTFKDVRPLIDANGSVDILIARQESAVAIPSEAVISEEDGEEVVENFVFVIKGDNKHVEKRVVMLGLEGDEYYEIESGISEGEVITMGENVSKLSDGAKIHIGNDRQE